MDIRVRGRSACLVSCLVLFFAAAVFFAGDAYGSSIPVSRTASVQVSAAVGDVLSACTSVGADGTRTLTVRTNMRGARLSIARDDGSRAEFVAPMGKSVYRGVSGYSLVP